MENNACRTCERRAYKAGGMLRCLQWKIHTTIVRCSEYVGVHPESHIKIAYGPAYASTLARARSGRE